MLIIKLLSLRFKLRIHFNQKFKKCKFSVPIKKQHVLTVIRFIDKVKDLMNIKRTFAVKNA